MRRKTAAICTALLLLCTAALSASAAGVDYKELQEEPLETAIRKLASPGNLEWDKKEMMTGGAPDFIKNMKWPLRTGFFSRGFRRGAHTGADLTAPKGTPVYAALDGVVEVVSNGGAGFRGYGKVIVINHYGKLWTLYSHQSANLVKVGQRVKQGEKIGLVGRTGRATANHVHFEVRNARGTPLDPMKYLPQEGRLPRR
ncbi:MAG: M23 family metallopeptidase [Cloacibacillus sp.]